MGAWTGLVLSACLAAMPARADTLRVGTQVLVTGDSAARVVELLGPPAHKASGAAGKAGTRKPKQQRGAKGQARAKPTTAKAAEGERWQYRQGRRTVTVVIVQGKVARIE